MDILDESCLVALSGYSARATAVVSSYNNKQ